MTRTMLMAAFALALLSLGCGNSTSPGTGQLLPPAPDTAFSLRITGDDVGDFLSARMRIKSVQVSSGGAILANDLRTPEVELTDTGNSYLLTRFQAPAGTEEVEFEVAFEGGTIATSRGAAQVEAACETLRLGGKVSRIGERRHAVIHLDLSRSLLPS
ncbi:MAG: hypothetical protein ACXWLR_16210, partial [Myxococcales bacterium]